MKGGYYGASGAIAPGAMEYKSSSEMGDWAVSKRGGNTMIGSGHKKRKTHKKTRRHRKHRGGGKYGAVSASFQGSGQRGLGNVAAINTKGPAESSGDSRLGAFNDGGANPGSGYGSFIRAH